MSCLRSLKLRRRRFGFTSFRRLDRFTARPLASLLPTVAPVPTMNSEVNIVGDWRGLDTRLAGDLAGDAARAIVYIVGLFEAGSAWGSGDGERAFAVAGGKSGPRLTGSTSLPLTTRMLALTGTNRFGSGYFNVRPGLALAEGLLTRPASVQPED